MNTLTTVIAKANTGHDISQVLSDEALKSMGHTRRAVPVKLNRKVIGDADVRYKKGELHATLHLQNSDFTVPLWALPAFEFYPEDLEIKQDKYATRVVRKASLTGVVLTSDKPKNDLPNLPYTEISPTESERDTSEQEDDIRG